MRFLIIRKYVIFIIFSLLFVLFFKGINTLKKEPEETLVRQENKRQTLPSKDAYPTPSLEQEVTGNGNAYFLKNNEVWMKTKDAEKQLTYDGAGEYNKNVLNVSPQQNYLAYFQDLSLKEGMNSDEYYRQNYTSLRILDLKSNTVTEVYKGSYKVGDYEWLSEREISVWIDCGSECSYLELIDIPAKRRRQLMYGVGYTWSPDKKYALAYHYSIQPGITVGDRFGNKIFTLMRDYPKEERVSSTHKAAWSADSSKLALIINKDRRPEPELLIFDVKRGFKTIIERDLKRKEFSRLEWRDNNVEYY